MDETIQTKIINYINNPPQKEYYEYSTDDPDLTDFLIEEGDIKFNKKKRKYEWISK